MPRIFYEDLSVGDTAEFGEYEVTREEIVEFAERYDPQWFHVDPERAAEESMYGGLIASGWHTASITMRVLVDHHFGEAASLGAKGLEELRWRRPVRPGDVLSVRTEVLDKEPERPDRGLVTSRAETLTDDGELALSMVSLVMYARRGSDGGK
ncbi:MaoC family dehydratase [Halegenticoccus soli]|uniref:MaoC family dehydratase n=1 Tax=Halegenticoccus soli TaxID=1985678 RepID=UPI000C6E5C99|nr:MaoC family dehydratase [Halegenticoccus soli]